MLVLDGRWLRVRIQLPEHFKVVLDVELRKNLALSVDLDVGGAVFGAVELLEFKLFVGGFFVYHEDWKLSIGLLNTGRPVPRLIVLLHNKSVLCFLDI